MDASAPALLAALAARHGLELVGVTSAEPLPDDRARMAESVAAGRMARMGWMGGDRPTLEDDLFESIADEMREQTDDLAGAVAEGEPWEFTIPTQLVWLQGDPALPVFT